MQVYKTIKSLISVAIVICLCIGLYIPVFADDTTTVTITGQDLYNLLASGYWTASIPLGTDGTIFTTDNNLGMTLYLSDNGICSASFYFKVDDVVSSVVADYIDSPNILFSTSSDYSDVVDFCVTLGGSTSFSISHSGGVAENKVSLKDFGLILHNDSSVVGTASGVPTSKNSSAFTYYYPFGNTLTSATQSVLLYNVDCVLSSSSNVTGFNIFSSQNGNLDFTSSSYANVQTAYVCTTLAISNITVTCSSSVGAGDIEDDIDSAASDVSAAIKEQTEVQEKFYSNMLTPTDEDKSKLDDLEQNMQDTQDKVDDYNEAKDSVETPDPEDVLPGDSVDNILQDENITQGQSYIFSILESLQAVTWILLMILISVTVGVIKYIIYGKS